MGTAVAARLTRWSPPEQVGLAMLLDQRSERCVPGRALLLSLAALAVPVVGALRFPEALGEQGALLWLLALVPAFLQAYHRGWRGVATALAVGMATLSSTQAIVLWRGLAVPDLLLGVVVAYLAIALGIGWIAELLHRQRAEVEDLALTDLLTHLPNRRHARVFLDNEFAAAARGRLLSVVLFDLDRFKQFNDRYGHPAGDEALQAFAEVLAHTTRRSNLSARFGGEEFVSILAGSDGEGAVVFAERVRSGLQARHLGDDPLTVSAGVACHQPAMSSPDELLAAADEALYEAKDAGRNCVRLYAGTPPEAVAGHLPDSLITDSFGPADSYPRADTEIGKTPPPPELLPDPGPPFGTGHRALLVEDEASVRELIATYLRREGFAVTSAASVAEGVRALKEEFDVVVTDIHLPGSSGRDLVAAVKSRWPVTQVLVMTGLQDAQVAAQALDAGADRYLFKPFGLPELRTHLLDALSRRERLLQERARKQDLSG
ncbi:MAG TPA: diguanylate cyclase, partial [Longimicrobiales bacterium]